MQNERQALAQTEAPALKKRKSSSLKDSPPKRSRTSIQSFFTPQICQNRQNDGGQIVSLSKEQNDVLRMVVDEGKNAFFTGAAGTGKSLLLRAIINSLRRKYAGLPDAVGVTASTGMAASNIGGMTIHAWGAVAPTVTDIGLLISYIKKCKPAWDRWKNSQVLIIDEVSMIDGHLFTRLAAIANRLRKKTDRPFGGIQLIVTGDFFQLPPVCPSNTDPFFAFESEAWTTCIEHTVALKEVFRQKDNDFVSLLNEMRLGNIEESAIPVLRSLSRTLPPHPAGITATELFPTRAEVNRANAHQLSGLPTRPRIFIGRDTGAEADEHKRTRLLEGVAPPRKLELKVDAQVMLVKNIDGSLVNGSIGRILGFWKAKDVIGKSGQAKGSAAIRNVRLTPDQRSPIHPSAEEDKENTVDDKAGSKPPSSTKAKPKIEEPLPLVLFVMPDGRQEAVLLGREEFRVENSEGRVLARRMHIPLVLAWAVSIHKSQGQTLSRIRVDLGKVFEKGQTYVALSRASSMEGLQVLRFDPKKVKAHPKVIEWMKRMEDNQGAS